jgi:phthalate 4,5-dioxygenase reductase component
MSDRFETPTLQLRIAKRAEIARDIVEIELVHPQGSDLPEFTAGAHVSLRVPKGLIRKYSLCNDPEERHRYVIAVKREDPGTGGSLSLTSEAKEGDIIEVGEPRNDFALAPNIPNFLFIAGGIGITPILSMMRHLKSTGAGRFKLYYLTRSRELTAFHDEIKKEFAGQVVIHHDEGDPDKMYDLWPVLEKPQGRHLYCCGPRPLMEAVRDMSGHWSSAAVHFEDFGATKPAHKADDKPFRVRLARSGQTFEVPADVSILDALRANGVNVSSSCESGTCGSCRTKLLEGEAEHRDLVLTEREHKTNIMICVSRAKSDELVLDL